MQTKNHKYQLLTFDDINDTRYKLQILTSGYLIRENQIKNYYLQKATTDLSNKKRSHLKKFKYATKLKCFPNRKDIEEVSKVGVITNLFIFLNTSLNEDLEIMELKQFYSLSRICYLKRTKILQLCSSKSEINNKSQQFLMQIIRTFRNCEYFKLDLVMDFSKLTKILNKLPSLTSLFLNSFSISQVNSFLNFANIKHFTIQSSTFSGHLILMKILRILSIAHLWKFDIALKGDFPDLISELLASMTNFLSRHLNIKELIMVLKYKNLSSLQNEKLFESIINLADLKILNLEFFSIWNLKQSLKALSKTFFYNLTTLILQAEHIENFDNYELLFNIVNKSKKLKKLIINFPILEKQNHSDDFLYMCKECFNNSDGLSNLILSLPLQLRELKLAGILLDSSNYITKFADKISRLRHLRELNVNFNIKNPHSFKVNFSKAFKHLVNLKYLSLCVNEITPRELFYALSSLINLCEMKLQWKNPHDITKEDILIMISTLQNFKSLYLLYLGTLTNKSLKEDINGPYLSSFLNSLKSFHYKVLNLKFLFHTYFNEDWKYEISIKGKNVIYSMF